MNIELIKEKVRLVKLSHEGKSIIEIFRDLNFVIGYLDNNYPYINETKGCNIKTTKLRAVLLNPNLCENELTEVLIDSKNLPCKYLETIRQFLGNFEIVRKGIVSHMHVQLYGLIHP